MRINGPKANPETVFVTFSTVIVIVTFPIARMNPELMAADPPAGIKIVPEASDPKKTSFPIEQECFWKNFLVIMHKTLLLRNSVWVNVVLY